MFLGIDVGHSAMKAVVFDDDWNEAVSAHANISMYVPKPGHYETSIKELWSQTKKVLREITEKVNPNLIKGIGICGGANGLYPLDENLNPVGRGITILDQRAKYIIDKLKKEEKYDTLFRKLGMPVLPGAASVVLRWLKDHEYERYRKIKHILARKDVVRLKLTGDVSTEITDACFGLLNVRTQEYDEEIFEILGIEEMIDALPELRPNSYDIAGFITEQASRETGLKEGTPVVVGAHDACCNTLGVGAVRNNIVCTGGGTWSINLLVVNEPLLNPMWSCESFVEKGTWILEGSSPTATISLDWFVKNFCSEERRIAEERGESIYKICDEEISDIETTIIYLPFLIGLPWNYPFQSNATAGFLGIRMEHSKKEFLRAVYEGVTFIHALHIEQFEKNIGVSEVRFTGGAAKSEIWCQMLADVLEKRVLTVDKEETGCFGAALLAAIGVGEINDVQDVVKFIKIKKVYKPREAEKYRRKYEIFKLCGKVLSEVWNRLEELEHV